MTTPEASETPAGPETPETPAETPPWGKDEDFDPQKAWKLLQNVKADLEKAKSRPVLDDDAKRKLDEYERLEQASKTDLERKTEEVTRWQTEAETWRGAAVASRIQALAATDFADPDDAVKALDASKYLDAGGVINDQAITADLAALLEAKPHYRRAGEPSGPRLPAPNPAQGSSTTPPATDPAQIFDGVMRNLLPR